MKMLLWGFLYLVLTILLLIFFIKEKKILEKFENIEEKLADKLTVNDNKKEKYKKIKLILTIIAIFATVCFYYFTDRKPNVNISIMLPVIYIVYIINVLVLGWSWTSRKSYYEWIIILNGVMLVLGKMMFDIHDNVFYIFLVTNIILSILLIIFSQYNLQKALHRIQSTFTAVVIVLLIQTFYFGNFVVPTGSMEPTIEVNDRFFANMFIYKFKKPELEDIIAFKEPTEDKVMYTKRLVAEPGMTLQIKDNKIVLNDTITLGREYVQEGIIQDKKIYIPKKGDKIKLKGIVLSGMYAEEDLSSTFNDNNVKAMKGEILSENTEEGKINILLSVEEILSTGITSDMLAKSINTKQMIEIFNEKNSIEEKEIEGMKLKIAPIKVSTTNGEERTIDLFNIGGLVSFVLTVEGREEMVMPIMELRNKEQFEKLINGETIELENDYYFAMGDNTRNSLDSRYFGNVRDTRIKGKLLFRFFPINKIGVIK